MRCPKCGEIEDKVIDSRESKDGEEIRRRRECLKCGERFTTYEKLERETLQIVKRDGRRQPFDRHKLRAGIQRACEKRPVSAETIDRVVDEVAVEIERKFDREAPSTAIGEAVMKRLRDLDEVAYVRFASVYRQFRDAEEFVEEIQSMKKE